MKKGISGRRRHRGLNDDCGQQAAATFADRVHRSVRPNRQGEELVVSTVAHTNGEQVRPVVVYTTNSALLVRFAEYIYIYMVDDAALNCRAVLRSRNTALNYRAPLRSRERYVELTHVLAGCCATLLG